MLIDTHAHLYYNQFKPDFDAVLERAKTARVYTILNVGTDLKTSKKALQQVLEYEAQSKSPLSEIKFYSSIGIHPGDAEKLPTPESIRQHIEKLEELYQSNTIKVVAVGECGLDYFSRNTSPLSPQTKQAQLTLFREHIKLAEKLNLPLIIHCRPSTSSGLKDAWEDIFTQDLRSTSGVFHSFTGTLEDARKALDLGYYLGLTCIITYPKNDYLRQIIKEAPLEKLLTETDCPFLPPQNQRGKRNEPANVLEVLRTIAEVKNLSPGKAEMVIYQNAQRLFGIV